MIAPADNCKTTDTASVYARVYVVDSTAGTVIIYEGPAEIRDEPRWIAPSLTPEQLLALAEVAAEEKSAPDRDNEPRPTWPTPHDDKSPKGPSPAGQCRPCTMLARPPPGRLELVTAAAKAIKSRTSSPCPFYLPGAQPMTATIFARRNETDAAKQYRQRDTWQQTFTLPETRFDLLGTKPAVVEVLRYENTLTGPGQGHTRIYGNFHGRPTDEELKAAGWKLCTEGEEY